MNVFARTLRRFAAPACLSVLGACANPPPGSPPPTGANGTKASLFFPIAVAVHGDNLYVANSNFDRAYTNGTLVQLKLGLIKPSTVPTTPVALEPIMIGSVGLVDSFAGTMKVNGAGNRLYVTTRDHGTLSTAALAADGTLLCASQGCSFDAIPLTDKPNFMNDPFAIQLARLPLEGSTTPRDVVLVSHLSPAPSGTNGKGLDANVAVIPEPTGPAVMPTSDKAFSTVSYRVDIGALGADALDVSPDGSIYVGGCFVRVTGETVVPCLADSGIPQFLQNPLRFFFGNANSNAEVQTTVLGTYFNGGQTQDIAVSSDGTKLFVATTTPNALLTIDLPRPGGNPVPTLRSTIVLANVPNRILKLQRPNQGDLLVITAADPNVVLATTNSLLVVDPDASDVVAQIEPLGKTPYGMTALPVPDGSTATPVLPTDVTTTGYRIFVALFGACGVAEVDVDLASPADTHLVSILGSCP